MLLVSMSGCVPVSGPGSDPTDDGTGVRTMTDSNADEATPVLAVVRRAVDRLDTPSGVYLNAEGLEEDVDREVRSSLNQGQEPVFRPTSARINGYAGASIALGRFMTEPDGRLRVVTMLVGEDSTKRMCSEYVLESTDDEWRVAEETDVLSAGGQNRPVVGG